MRKSVETAQGEAHFSLNKGRDICCNTSKTTSEIDQDLAGSAILNEHGPMKYEQHLCLESISAYVFADVIGQVSSPTQNCIAGMSKPSTTITENNFAMAYHRAVINEDQHTGGKVHTECVKQQVHETMSNITLTNTEHSGNVLNTSERHSDVNSYQRCVCSDKGNIDGGCYKSETSEALDKDPDENLYLTHTDEVNSGLSDWNQNILSYVATGQDEHGNQVVCQYVSAC